MKIYYCEHKPTGDYAGSAVCREQFRTASAKSVHEDQLIASGWTIAKTRGGPTRLYCPAHRPPPITMEQNYTPPRS